MRHDAIQGHSRDARLIDIEAWKRNVHVDSYGVEAGFIRDGEEIVKLDIVSTVIERDEKGGVAHAGIERGFTLQSDLKGTTHLPRPW